VKKDAVKTLPQGYLMLLSTSVRLVHFKNNILNFISFEVRLVSCTWTAFL